MRYCQTSVCRGFQVEILGLLAHLRAKHWCAWIVKCMLHDGVILCCVGPFRLFSVCGLNCILPGKAARDMYMKVVAAENPSLSVLSYAPGPVDTAMFDQLGKGVKECADTAQGTPRLWMMTIALNCKGNVLIILTFWYNWVCLYGHLFTSSRCYYMSHNVLKMSHNCLQLLIQLQHKGQVNFKGLSKSGCHISIHCNQMFWIYYLQAASPAWFV